MSATITGQLTNAQAGLPEAWLGYVSDTVRGGAMVRICSYCPDKNKADEMAQAACLIPTHGCCPSCFSKQIALIHSTPTEN